MRMTWLINLGAAAAVVCLLGYTFLWRSLDERALRSKPWAVEASEAAEYTVVEDYRIRLERGELQIPPTPSGESVTVETEFAVATADGSKFNISKESRESSEPQPAPLDIQVTTVQVISGSVTLTTPDGTIVGEAGDTLIAEEGKAPRKE